MGHYRCFEPPLVRPGLHRYSRPPCPSAQEPVLHRHLAARTAWIHLSPQYRAAWAFCSHNARPGWRLSFRKPPCTTRHGYLEILASNWKGRLEAGRSIRPAAWPCLVHQGKLRRRYFPSEEMHRAAKEKREADKKKGVPTPWGSVYEAMIDELLR